jgi:hypothetical protein
VKAPNGPRPTTTSLTLLLLNDMSASTAVTAPLSGSAKAWKPAQTDQSAQTVLLLSLLHGSGRSLEYLK